MSSTDRTIINPLQDGTRLQASRSDDGDTLTLRDPTNAEAWLRIDSGTYAPDVEVFR